jgi:hypothetical protein
MPERRLAVRVSRSISASLMAAERAGLNVDVICIQNAC